MPLRQEAADALRADALRSLPCAEHMPVIEPRAVEKVCLKFYKLFPRPEADSRPTDS